MFGFHYMKIMVFIVFFSLILFQSLEKVVSTSDSADVCIIGAGPSGIQAAYTLDGFGYSTAIFEKESYIGGKTKTMTVDGIRYRLGAVLHSPGKASSLTNLLDKFNITSPSANLRRIIHVISEKDQSIQKFIIKNPLRFLLAFLRYEWKRRSLNGLEQPDAYLQPKYSQQEFLTSLGSWLRRNRLSAFQDLCWLYITTFGYGRIEAVPALYGLKYALGTIIDESAILQSRATQPFFQDLLMAMAKSLQQGAVYLNTSISSVSYGTTNNVIAYTQAGNLVEQQMTCGSIIIAFPQITSRMVPVFIPPTVGMELTNLTDQVKVVDYYTLMYATEPSKMKNLNKNERVLAFIPRGSSGSIPEGNIAYAKMDPISTASVTAYYLTESPKTDKYIQQLSLESYKKLTGNTAANDSIIQSFDKWEYFPHVSSESIRDGFYEKFNNLQGKANQYYTGALFTFETVQEAMAHSKYLIEKYFSKKSKYS